MFVIVLEFDSLEQAHEGYMDELANMCYPEGGTNPLYQTRGAAEGAKTHMEGMFPGNRYEIYELIKCNV